MRVLACVLILVVACKGSEKTKSRKPPIRPPIAEKQADVAMDAWARIEALAVPVTTAGPATELLRAVEIAERNEAAWSPHRYKFPPAALSEYPEGSAALAALEAWVAARGGLLPQTTPTKLGRSVMNVRAIGALAIAAATAERDTLPLAIYLGGELVRSGRNFLELQVGISLLRDAKRKLKEANDPRKVTADSDLVRILAAEALHTRRATAYALTPEGKKEIEEALAKLDPKAKATFESFSGASIEKMIPDDEQRAAWDAFWLAALDGARRGEDGTVTIARVRKAADASHESIKQTVAMIANMTETIKNDLDALPSDDPF